VLDFCLTVALPFAVDAAAISLVIESELSGQAMALPKAIPEILIVELHSAFVSRLLSCLSQQAMCLIGAYEQCGGKRVKTFFSGDLCGTGQPYVEAGGAAFPFALVADYESEVFEHVVTLSDDQGNVFCFGECLHCLKTLSMLAEGVDVGIVPEGGNVETMLFQVFNHVD